MARGSKSVGRSVRAAAARQVVASLGARGASDELASLSAFCRRVAENGWAAFADATFAALTPIAAYATFLGGAVFLQCRAGMRSEAELKAHFAEIAEALERIARDAAQAEQMLAAIHNRSRFVWAKLDGEDKQAIAARVKDALEPLLHDLGLTGTVDLEDLWIIAEDTNECVRDILAGQQQQATKADVAGLARADQIEDLTKQVALLR
jgi:hypothetical protein